MLIMGWRIGLDGLAGGGWLGSACKLEHTSGLWYSFSAYSILGVWSPLDFIGGSRFRFVVVRLVWLRRLYPIHSLFCETRDFVMMALVAFSSRMHDSALFEWAKRSMAIR